MQRAKVKSSLPFIYVQFAVERGVGVGAAEVIIGFTIICRFLISPQHGPKETVLDLPKFVDKGVQVKRTGGRQGTLKGYDQLLNLVLDEAIEFIRDPVDPLKTTDQHRRLGLIQDNNFLDFSRWWKQKSRGLSLKEAWHAEYRKETILQ
ncbi:uncharacterized protein LOC122080061 [Macadamia integrifolia]|uniref:uncharacterized protein LOC122080061 n=1 Tax=Macadamia integrifolia TaxID=60698 RepID=UPI001C4F1C39|nr:uncharacterized protein LOC122080061 [Macadamia integrifolia]